MLAAGLRVVLLISLSFARLISIKVVVLQVASTLFLRSFYALCKVSHVRANEESADIRFCNVT